MLSAYDSIEIMLLLVLDAVSSLLTTFKVD